MKVLGHLRVRDMPRSQQRAVFAKMSDDGYLAALEGAEKYQRRRDYLIRKNELEDTYEDKIFRAYNNPKLTHRQRMDRISKLKKEAMLKLQKAQGKEASETIVGSIREENLRRFKKEFDIKEVPVGKDGKAISFERGNIARAEKTVIAKKLAKKKGVISPHAVAADIVKAGGKSSDRKAVIKEHHEQLKKAGIADKTLTWKQIKTRHKRANPEADYDLDGVKNVKDCKPMNKKEQDLTDKALKIGIALGKAGIKKIKGKTSAERITEAKAKLAKYKAKEEAIALESKAKVAEAEAKAAEAKYKREHPKRFGII